jgi:hypothetical protein
MLININKTLQLVNNKQHRSVIAYALRVTALLNTAFHSD